MGHPLTVMTWNVRYFGHGLRGLRSTRGGMRRAARALATLVPLPDLVALQEVETRSLRSGLSPVPQLERFLAELHAHLAELGRPERFRGLYFPAHSYRVRGSPALYTTGLAVLVGPGVVLEDDNATDPHDITHVRVQALAALKQRRVVGHVRVRPADGGPSLDLFNTHLSLPAFFEVGPTKVPERMGHGSNQLEEIQRVLDFVQGRTQERAVLVGDFNTRPGSPAYRAVLAAGFHDAYATANGLDDEALHAHATAGFGPRRMHIDHVFASEGVTWDTVDGFPFGERHAFHGVSDHTPKLGRLLLPREPA
ncbi:MAG: endonuclease/exonuclease/phosphatase family protein [Alphaproteobacteria bacterium]|nr:endonuclease/exonuclease/phosphatase family protein [Alphaproteobacteria bacterium]